MKKERDTALTVVGPETGSCGTSVQIVGNIRENDTAQILYNIWKYRTQRQVTFHRVCPVTLVLS